MKHLFIRLFAICIFSLMRYFWRALAYFQTGLFIFLLLIFKSSLCILENSILSYVSFANISPSFPYQLHHFTTPPPVHKGFIFSTISLTVGIFCFVVVVLTVAIPMDGLPRWLSCKESTYNAGDADSIPGSGRSPRKGNGNPLQYSCLENPMDGGAW